MVMTPFIVQQLLPRWGFEISFELVLALSGCIGMLSWGIDPICSECHKYFDELRERHGVELDASIR